MLLRLLHFVVVVVVARSHQLTDMIRRTALKGPETREPKEKQWYSRRISRRKKKKNKTEHDPAATESLSLARNKHSPARRRLHQRVPFGVLGINGDGRRVHSVGAQQRGGRRQNDIVVKTNDYG